MVNFGGRYIFLFVLFMKESDGILKVESAEWLILMNIFQLPFLVEQAVPHLNRQYKFS